MTPEYIKGGLSKTNNIILKVAAVVGAITIIAGGYTWYLNNLWKPHVEVLSIDFENGKAQLKHKDDIIDLDGDSIYWINADWGVKIGSVIGDSGLYYDRIELLKKGMVVEYLKRDTI